MKTGLVSVSFRQLNPPEVIELARRCGLQAIEWGGDVHVPPGDVANAAAVGNMTRAAGLEVACYGSYYRLTDAESGMAEAVVNTARALGAPLIRVWAGMTGSADTAEDMRCEICRNARRLADLAAEAEIGVAFEWHGGTLTDTLDSAVRLLRDVAHPNVGTLWQPPVGADAETCVQQIRAVGKYIRNIHVFSWQGIERLALADGEAKWRRCLAEIGKLPGQRCLLLEFVRNDDADQLLEDADALCRWLKGE